MEFQNHYATLRIDRCASNAEIKQAYRMLAHRFHPDVSDDQDGEQRFKEISEAYRTLRKPESRSAYDLTINNFCGCSDSTRVSVVSNIEIFNYGLIFWSYWLFFWPIQASHP